MDYRKFLGKEEELVMPYLGGPSVDAPDQRRLRVPEPFEPAGWYRFTVKGRIATRKEPTDPPDLSKLPAVRGHLLGDRLVREGAVAERLSLMPEAEAPRLAPATARRWPGGALLFDQLEFEGEVEDAARRALEDEAPLAELKGAPATLRAAYGYALLEQAGARLRVPASPAEVRPQVAEVAQAGRAVAERVLRALAAEREQAVREMEELRRRHAALRAAEVRAHRAAALAVEQERLELALAEQRAARQQAHAGLGYRGRHVAADRAVAALEDAGARVHSTRATGGGQLEVVYTFMHERFISVVDMATLQVVDSGICLGHPPRDDLVTLESLPSVIKEAIDTGRLVKLRHA